MFAKITDVMIHFRMKGFVENIFQNLPKADRMARLNNVRLYDSTTIAVSQNDIFEAKSQVDKYETGSVSPKVLFLNIRSILKRPDGFWKLEKQLKIAKTFLYKIQKYG